MSKIKNEILKDINKTFQENLGVKNQLAVPHLEKVIINVGLSKAKENANFKKAVSESLMAISGQKPKITTARMAISGFKIREGDEVGMVVTLRGNKMYDFVYKLANITLPRMRDFRGLDKKGFDKQGNYTISLTEQIIFPEISHEKAEILHGMSITLTTTCKNSHEGQLILEALGFPFKKKI